MDLRFLFFVAHFITGKKSNEDISSNLNTVRWDYLKKKHKRNKPIARCTKLIISMTS